MKNIYAVVLPSLCEGVRASAAFGCGHAKAFGDPLQGCRSGPAGNHEEVCS